MESAEKFTDFGYGDRERTLTFYYAYNFRIEFLDNSRKGFYCMMCAIEGQKAVFTTWKIFKWLYNRRVYYHKEFCLLIVQHTETTSYDIYKNVNHYLRNLLGFLFCIDKPSEDGSNRNR